jgi:hypothetical protein
MKISMQTTRGVFPAKSPNKSKITAGAKIGTWRPNVGKLNKTMSFKLRLDIDIDPNPLPELELEDAPASWGKMNELDHNTLSENEKSTIQKTHAEHHQEHPQARH